jgi:hypothetical protein
MTTTAPTTPRATAFQREMARYAHQVHDSGCCTPAARCRLGAYLETVLDAAPAPDVRSADTAPRARTTGAGRSRRTARADVPTMGQMTTLTRLLDELADAAGEAAKHRDNARLLLANNDMTFHLASLYLDRLIPAARALRAEAAAARAANNTAAAQAAADLEPGMYARDGKVYRVVLSEAGRLYAKVWAEGADDTPARFEFAPGAIRDLRPEHRMSIEAAKTYSRRIGACCVCGKTLTNAKSIERGIGPVCAGNV